MQQYPRDEGTRKGITALAILLVLGFGLLAFACGGFNFVFLYPSKEGWIWFGGGFAIAALCAAIAIFIFRQTSPDRNK